LALIILQVISSAFNLLNLSQFLTLAIWRGILIAVAAVPHLRGKAQRSTARTPSTGPARIAVLDVGKTNLKLLVASEDGWPLETHTIPNGPNTAGPFLAYDLAGLEEWFLDTLAVVSQRHAIGAVIATAHGCGAVLVD